MKRTSIDGPRPCRKNELSEVIALVDNEMRVNTDQTMLTDYPLVYRDENLENVMIMKKDGELVSVVPFIPWEVRIEDCRFTIGIISPTATAPAHRRKGYGLACLNSCIEKMEQMHITLSVLWTMVRTFPFYEHARYQAIASQDYIYPCSRTDADKLTDHGHIVVDYDPRTSHYIEDIQRMHQDDIYGVHRNPDDYRVLFNLPKIKTMLALQNGEAVAYLLMSRAVNKPGIIEGGGNDRALETLLHHCLSSLDPQEIVNVTVSLTPSKLGNVLQRALPESKVLNTEENTMMRINDVYALFEAILSWLRRRNAGRKHQFSYHINDTNQTIGLVFKEDEVQLVKERIDPCTELSLQELTSIVFGAHAERPVPAVSRGELLQEQVLPKKLLQEQLLPEQLLPFYFPICILDHS